MVDVTNDNFIKILKSQCNGGGLFVLSPHGCLSKELQL
jgi:hypothetical protein